MFIFGDLSVGAATVLEEGASNSLPKEYSYAKSCYKVCFITLFP